MDYFTKENLGDHEDLEFLQFRKLGFTEAARVSGTFEVETTEGKMRCRNGWIAIDAKGNPYPIADEVLRASYERIEEVEDESEAEPQTVIQRFNALWHEINAMQVEAVADAHASREYALAKTAIEDAEMRFNRAMAYVLGRFEVADLQQ